jgi:hypothetical protein
MDVVHAAAELAGQVTAGQMYWRTRVFQLSECL